jgi:hypothetical protein
MSTTDQPKSRGGRPPAKDPKDCKVEARVTRGERAAIQQVAESHGLTVSDLLVISVLGAQARP